MTTKKPANKVKAKSAYRKRRPARQPVARTPPTAEQIQESLANIQAMKRSAEAKGYELVSQAAGHIPFEAITGSDEAPAGTVGQGHIDIDGKKLEPIINEALTQMFEQARKTKANPSIQMLGDWMLEVGLRSYALGYLTAQHEKAKAQQSQEGEPSAEA